MSKSGDSFIERRSASDCHICYTKSKSTYTTQKWGHGAILYSSRTLSGSALSESFCHSRSHSFAAPLLACRNNEGPQALCGQSLASWEELSAAKHLRDGNARDTAFFRLGPDSPKPPGGVSAAFTQLLPCHTIEQLAGGKLAPRPSRASRRPS